MHLNHITKLLGIKSKNVIVNDVFYSGSDLFVSLSMKKMWHTCPRCGSRTKKVHDYRKQSKIKHGKISGYKTYILYKKRRYVCKQCNTRFTESNDFVGRNSRISTNNKLNIISNCTKKTSFLDIANDQNISSSTVSRHFNSVTEYKTPLTLPEALSIDEFAAHTNEGKYAVALVDLSNDNLFDILPNRKKNFLEGYFGKYSYEERSKVKYVCMDMWSTYRSVVKECFPNAIIIADTFHVVRHVFWGFNRFRVKVMKSYPKDSKEYKLLKNNWRLLCKRGYELNDTTYFKNRTLGYHTTSRDLVDTILKLIPELVPAYYLKDEFYNLIDTSNKESIKDDLNDWIKVAKELNIYEFKDAIKAFRNWNNEICNSFIINPNTNKKYSNGIVEGINNLIKVIKRVGFGYRNFETFRKRILLIKKQSYAT